MAKLRPADDSFKKSTFPVENRITDKFGLRVCKWDLSAKTATSYLGPMFPKKFNLQILVL